MVSRYLGGGVLLPNVARYQLRHTPILNIKLFLAVVRCASCCRYRIARRKEICSRSATAATPFSSLDHPSGALGNVPNCAVYRQFLPPTYYNRFFVLCQEYFYRVGQISARLGPFYFVISFCDTPSLPVYRKGCHSLCLPRPPPEA